MTCFRHGHAAGGNTTREYKTWQSMMQRCYKPYAQQYDNYGARGISVCKRWHQFKNFLADMGMKPTGMTLERKNVDGNYSPSNCKWASTVEQNRNKRDTRKVTYEGRNQSIAEWARESGIKEGTLGARLRRYGWDVERAFTTNNATERLVTHHGVTDTLTGWAKRIGINRSTISKRLDRGIPIAQALTPL